jgi:phage terminase large subunit
MITTPVFGKTLKAYNDGFRYIGNKGSSRSSKTFSELQVIKTICENDKNSINTVVSHSFPHLEGGAIRDFENILSSSGYNVSDIKHVKPCYFKINTNIIEFIGFDNPGKALGASRKRLFINEANKMPFNVCHQLMQRTEEVVFVDWNPSEEFWWENEGFEKRDNATTIHSTFLENYNPLTGINNLTKGQLEEFYFAKCKAEAEDKAGKRGYWWNWWQVYGLGLKGQLEGVIFQNWQEFEILPDCELFRMLVIDWGGFDPTTLTELYFDGNNNHLYVIEHIYKPQILNSKLIEYIHSLPECPVICDSARKDKIFELQMAQIQAYGATKGEGSIIDGIERLQEFTIFVHQDSENIKHEFKNYKRVQDVTGKYLDIPEDKNNHAIDSIRYGARYYRKYIKPI